MNNYNTKTNTNKNNQKNRTDTWKMKKKTLITLAIVAAIAIPIGIYTVSPLFISATVNEPLPATTSVPTEKPLSGIFMSVGDGFHHVAGNVKVVSLTDGSKILRLDNFKSTNWSQMFTFTCLLINILQIT